MKKASEITRQAVIYCRVSDYKQIKGYSLGTQRQICTDYALRNGYEIVEEFIEKGESAKTADRTELHNMLRFCSSKRNNIKAVIYYKIDRFARYSQDYHALKFQLSKYGVKMVSATENISDDPVGRLMESILAAQGQFDNEIRTERSMDGMREAIRDGRYVWRAPFGYSNTLVGERGNLVQNSQAPIIREAFMRVAQNTLPVDEVRREMAKRGLISKNGKPFAKGYFFRLLKNKLYMGVIEKMGEVARGAFEPIVSEELFELVQVALKNRGRKMRRYQRDSHDFPLRRFIKHPEGYSLRGGWSRGKAGKTYPYYRYEQVKGVNFKRVEMERIFRTFLSSYSLDEIQAERLVGHIRAQYREQTKDMAKQQEQARKRLNELTERINALVEKNLAGVIPDEVLKSQFSLMEKEKTEIYGLGLFDEEKKIDPAKALRTLKRFYQDPASFWATADYENRIQLQMFTFPSGLIFDGFEMRTPETCEILRVSDQFKASNGVLVRQNSGYEEKCLMEAMFLDEIRPK